MLVPFLALLIVRAATAQYSLIVDAGSSGSRIRIFNSTLAGPVAAVTSKDDESAFEIEPGLSSFVGRPEGAGASLANLLQVARKFIPAASQSSSPLWVKATAGMRLLPQPEREAIVESVRRYLNDPAHCPFRFMSIAVLGGEEEAAFAYLGVNTMLSLPSPVGILDMGGASLQVAFKPAANILDGKFSLYVEDDRQSVYARSFVQFGMDAAILRAKQMLARSAGAEATSIDFPCFNRGFSDTAYVDGRQVKFVGTGDSLRCGEIAHSLLHAEYECMLPPCPLMGVHMPPLSGKERFFAMSNFFYIPNGLGLLGWEEMKVVRPSEIAAATHLFCNKTMQAAMADSGMQLKYARNLCFGGHYIGHVLQASGFEADSTAITCLRRWRDHAVDWTMGAVLYETLDMPKHRGAAAALAQPCGAAAAAAQGGTPPQPPRRSGLGGATGALATAKPPGILGLPAWCMWGAILVAATALGWFVHLLPQCCGNMKWDDGRLQLPQMPMSPVSLFGPEALLSPPSVFRALSAPSLATLGRSRSSRRVLG